MIQTYLNRIFDIEQQHQGDLRKEQFYWSLANLLRQAAEEEDRGVLTLRILPPDPDNILDIRISSNRTDEIGYVVTAAPGADLDVLAQAEAFERACSNRPNLLLTDFYEFRHYVGGAGSDQAHAAHHGVGSTAPGRPEDTAGFRRLLAGFLAGV